MKIKTKLAVCSKCGDGICRCKKSGGTAFSTKTKNQITTALLLLLACVLFSGCAHLDTIQTHTRTEIGTNGLPDAVIATTTRTRIGTFFDANSGLANFAASQGQTNQAVSIGSLNQNSTSTNLNAILGTVVSAAVGAAVQGAK